MLHQTTKRSTTHFGRHVVLFGKRHLSWNYHPDNRTVQYVPVRVRGPILWSIVATSLIVLGGAAWDVGADVKDVRRRRLWPTASSSLTYEQLQAAKNSRTSLGLWRSAGHAGNASRNHDSKDESFSILQSWNRLDGPQRTIYGIMGLCTSVWAGEKLVASFLPRSSWQMLVNSFCHVPAGRRNFTLLTSTFGHARHFAHIGFNMFALYSFGSIVTNGRTFGDAGRSHGTSQGQGQITAFFLSTGIISSLGYHLTSIWPSRSSRLVPSLGASGSLMALVAVFAHDNPDSAIGLVFLPSEFSIAAPQAVLGIAAFDTVGLVGTAIRGGRPLYSIPISHAAHLAGLAAGVAYVHFNGNRYIWEPARRYAFERMQAMGWI